MQEGTVLDGRYRLIEAIGAGGFGQVWAAHDPKIDRLVAVKVLTGDAGSSRQVARFAREAAFAGGLAHPNIVTVHDFGSTTHNGQPCAPATSSQRQQYQRFCWRILPAEAELLHHTARALLDEYGIDEPIQWAPRLPARTLHHLVLPGPDPDSISAARLHQAVTGSDFSLAHVARTLDTTTAHVAYLLSQHPVDWSPPRFRRTQHTATRALQWRTWYEQDHQSLQAIADREGTTLATVRLALLKHGTQLLSTPGVREEFASRFGPQPGAAASAA